MEQDIYIDIVNHYEGCFKQYGDSCKGVDWPNKDDVYVRYKVMLDIMKFDMRIIDKSKISLLDFGCGLGHLYEYILKNKVGVKYKGFDISQLFIQECHKKFPNVDFITGDILQMKDISMLKSDYIILNGVFTEKRELPYEHMLEYFKEMLVKIYDICNYGVAFNVMSKDVDWERDDLFHLPLNELSAFLTKELNRDFIIRYDYGLYEYTTYLYKR